MKKMKKYSSSLLALMLLLLIGCEREINLEHLRPDPKLVMNCLAIEGDTLSVELTRTWFYADNDVKDICVTGADVKLYVNDVFREQLAEVPVRYDNMEYDVVTYKSFSYFPATGDRIRLIASKSGFKDAEAVTEVPRPCSVSDIQLVQEIKRDTSRWEHRSYIFVSQANAMQFTLHDEPGVENYYLIYFRLENSSGGYGSGYWDGNAYGSSFTPDYGKEPLFAVQHSVLDVMLGYDGVGGYNGLAFTDELIDGKSYQFNIPWNKSYSYDEGEEYHPDKYHCYLYSVSRSYYNYMKTMQELYNSGFTGDLAESGFAEPIRIYSNVEGGTGILGGACLEYNTFVSQ